MMQMRDWVSFFAGVILTAVGLLPLLGKFGVGPAWFALSWLPVQLFAYLVAAAGFYLLINSVIEITNSNAIGWTSFFIAIAFLIIGVLQTLSRFNIGPDWFALSFIGAIVYQVIFVILGLFLMIACFAMEL